MEGKKNEIVQKKIRLVDTRSIDSSTGKVSDWFGYLYYCTDLYNGMWKLEKILEDIYKRLIELETTKKQQLSEIKGMFGEIKSLQQAVEKVSSLEAEKKEQCVEIEQLDQKSLQESNLLSSADLAFIISLNSINSEKLEKYLNSILVLKVKYLSSVALARISKNNYAENDAYNVYKFVAHVNYLNYGGSQIIETLCSEIEDKSPSEIVQMIKQVLNSTTMQNEYQGPQR